MVETTTPNQPLISVSSKHLYFFKSTQEDIIDVHQCPFIISHYATMVAEIFHLGDSTYFFWITIETIFLLNFNQSPCLGLKLLVMVKIPHFMVKNPLILVTNSNWSASNYGFRCSWAPPPRHWDAAARPWWSPLRRPRDCLKPPSHHISPSW